MNACVGHLIVLIGLGGEPLLRGGGYLTDYAPHDGVLHILTKK